jgi:hypothetical protein
MPRAEHKIPDSLNAEHIIEAAAMLDGNVDHPFHESTKFDVLIKNRRYAPKAILGVAAKIAADVDLAPADFTGGKGSKCFRILEDLGFKIVIKWDVTSSHTFVQGRIYNRKKDIHHVYGGNRQAGIARSESSSFIFIFSSSVGDLYGYRDGWSDDGIFLFTGERDKKATNPLTAATKQFVITLEMARLWNCSSQWEKAKTIDTWDLSCAIRGRLKVGLMWTVQVER